ncbi:hypothetical protein [Mycoplasma sp. Mirounga ES2805-ORL]|uniref:hypothetical protein n=1 Tax=Mycoplasma sp. Mirounga ES2805-ORL TaxID=754514 RepID=UPI00197B0C67|nr:hypothetical protein [Mycoplasma sp. Mirounga ES2805-ORL]QSF13680.1 hypothetical protein JXZ90_00015 [Mycoplasma sp. Mirounga ES2805-ORL]
MYETYLKNTDFIRIPNDINIFKDKDIYQSGVVVNAFYNIFSEFKAIKVNGKENLYITSKKLKESNIDLNLIKDFVNKVSDWVGDKFFTIESLLDSEFEHELIQEFGFDNIFYEFILQQFSDRFKSIMSSPRIFKKNTNRQNINFSNFVEHIIFSQFWKYDSDEPINAYDIEEYVLETYKYKFNSAKLKEVINSIGFYYDDVSHSIYYSKEEYIDII